MKRCLLVAVLAATPAAAQDVGPTPLYSLDNHHHVVVDPPLGSDDFDDVANSICQGDVKECYVHFYDNAAAARDAGSPSAADLGGEIARWHKEANATYGRLSLPCPAEGPKTPDCYTPGE